jgi:hypothetical protein
MRANSNRKPQNNKMQRTKLGQNGASPLILVLSRPTTHPARRSNRHWRLSALFCASGLLASACEPTFPLDALKDVTAIRVTRTQADGRHSVTTITDPRVLRQARALAERYNTWEVIPECRTSDCGDMLLEWIASDEVAVTMSVCGAGSRARVGQGGPNSPCGRRVTDQDTQTFLMGL